MCMCMCGCVHTLARALHLEWLSLLQTPCCYCSQVESPSTSSQGVWPTGKHPGPEQIVVENLGSWHHLPLASSCACVCTEE